MSEAEYDDGDEVTSACPACGETARRRAYDVGSGPELSCANCEWCWGANGQDLTPLDIDIIRGGGHADGS